MRKKLKIGLARSMDNGIEFFSVRHEGYMASSKIDELGNIKTEWTTTKKDEWTTTKKDEKNKVDIRVPVYAVILTIPLCFCLIIGEHMLAFRLFFIQYAFIKLTHFFKTRVICRKKRKDISRFHSAEHMVVNAYEKLNRVPTLKEIRNYSKFHNHCGTNETTEQVLKCILIVLCSFFSDSLDMLGGICAVNFIVPILLECGFLNFLQRYTTMEPTDKELLVAIAGMNVWVENEKKGEEEKSKFKKFLHRLFPRVFN